MKKMMEKVAGEKVKAHEKKMHRKAEKYADGGMVKGYADGGMVSKSGMSGCGNRGGLYGKDMKK
jgi:hypothetical protein